MALYAPMAMLTPSSLGIGGSGTIYLPTTIVVESFESAPASSAVISSLRAEIQTATP